MEIKHIRYDDYPPSSFLTLQLARLTCPYCSKPIQYVLSEDDISYKAEVEHLEEKVLWLQRKLAEKDKLISCIIYQKESK